MDNFAREAERITGKIIPFMLALLFFVLFADIFFSDFYYSHEFYMNLVDFAVVFVFSLDLLFKFIRIKKFSLFLRECWPDIIAVFPFIFLVNSIGFLSEVFSQGFGQGIDSIQAAMHSGVILGFHKSARFMNIMRPLFRLPRFLKILGRIHSKEKEKNK